jgi:hypothetical protein
MSAESSDPDLLSQPECSLTHSPKPPTSNRVSAARDVSTSDPIKGQIAVLMVVASLVGALLFHSIRREYRALSVASAELLDQSEFEHDLTLLANGIDRFSLMADQVLARENSYLSGQLSDQQRVIGGMIEGLEGSERFLGNRDYLSQIGQCVTSMGGAVDRTAVASGRRRDQVIAESSAAFDANNSMVVGYLSWALASLEENGQAAQVSVREARRQLELTAWRTCGFFLITLLTMFMWISRRLERPLRLLKAARVSGSSLTSS